jgi:hypothetical protein
VQWTAADGAPAVGGAAQGAQIGAFVPGVHAHAAADEQCVTILERLIDAARGMGMTG